MDHQRWRSAFLLTIVVCAVGYSCFTLWLYWEYVNLDVEKPLQSIEWSVYTKDEETHLIQASYSYPVDHVTHTGKYLFKRPVFINSLGAEHAIKEFSKDYPKVWVSSRNPSESSLVKQFPIKEIISTFILWAFFIYFMGLRVYCGLVG